MQPASAEWMEGQLAQVTLSQRRSLVWKAFPLTPDPEFLFPQQTFGIFW